MRTYIWDLGKSGALLRKDADMVLLNYVQYFNFLSLPLKFFPFDQRFAWLIYHKIFCGLSLLSVYCLGKRLLNPLCGSLSMLFYIITVLPLGFYYFYPSGDIGLMFFQAAGAKQVTQNIFLFAFYNTVLSAFREDRKQGFLFAGVILLCMLSIHQLSFIYGTMNYLMFSIMLIVLAARSSNKLYPEIVKILKNGFWVASLSIGYLVFLFISSGYFKEFMYYHNTWAKYQWDGPRSESLKNWNVVEKIKSLLGRAKVLIDTALVFGVKYWILKPSKKRMGLLNEFGSVFLFSNLLLYLLFKFPFYNVLTKFDFTTGRYIDALFLSYLILGFIIAKALENPRLKNITVRFSYLAIALSLLIYIAFGANNRFADHFRTKKHLAGDAYLSMTQYLNCVKTGPEGAVVLTDMKSSLDVFAFLNAYVFQFEGASRYPYSLNNATLSKIDDIIFSPQKNVDKVKMFINSKRVDYIVLPTTYTPWVPKERTEDNPGAIEFYKNLRGFELIYSDKNYYVFKKVI